MSVNGTALQLLTFSSTSLTPEDTAVYPLENTEHFLWREFVSKNWKWSLYAGALYLFTIFGLKRFMKSRPAMDLKMPLFWWNLGLGIFSIMGFVNTAPILLEKLVKKNGFYMSICTRCWMDVPMDFWIFMFIVSKFVELGDTVFIVLRKRPLVLLQYYHHVLTMNLVWITGPSLEPVSMWFTVLNYGVHSLMYPYFALRAIGVKIPTKFANLITTLQFCQMIVAFAVNALSTYYYRIGEDCARTDTSIKAMSFAYASFIVLFGQLFVDGVLKSGRLKRNSANGKHEKTDKQD